MGYIRRAEQRRRYINTISPIKAVDVESYRYKFFKGMGFPGRNHKILRIGLL